MVGVAEEVNARLREKSRHRPMIPAALLLIIQTWFNESFQNVFTSALPVIWSELMLLVRTLTMGYLRTNSFYVPGILWDAGTPQYIQKISG